MRAKNEILSIKKIEVERAGWKYFLDSEAYSNWMHQINKELDNSKPIDLINTIEGCNEIIQVLDLMESKKWYQDEK